MFEQSMVVTSPEMRRRKRWAALMSIAVEAAAVAAGLMIPLFTGHAVPPADPPPGVVTFRPHPDAMQVFHDKPAGVRHEPRPFNAFTQPSYIPGHTDRRPDTERHTYADQGSDPPIPGEIPGAGGPNINEIVRLVRPVVPIPAVVRDTVVRRTSTFMEGLLIHRVMPIYPAVAQRIRLQGPVVLQAMISREGTIEQLEVISGHPLLRQAAIDAVARWQYRPFMLNGQPVEVRTEVTVNFVLNQGE